MPLITIKDNSQKSIEDNPESIAFLEKFHDKSLKDIKKYNKDLIICGADYRGNEAQEKSEQKNEQKIWNLENDKLTTHNIVGVVGDGQTTVQINSRFDTEKSCNFLHYMLFKVFQPTVLDSKISYGNSNIMDLLPYLLASKYQQAYSQQGLYREYRTLEYNNAKPQGALDIARHIKENMPFGASICYRKRSREYDNPITRLLQCTFAYVKTKYPGLDFTNSRMLNNLPLREAITELQRHLPYMNPSDIHRQIPKILQATAKPIRSPYANLYEQLRKLCRAILQQQRIVPQNQKQTDQVHGILFDAAWLWEEYLNTLMLENTKHYYARQGKGRAIFTENGSGSIYPDFYNEDDSIVLDAKYKKLDSYGISDDDRDQMIRYLYLLKANQGILLYPTQNKEVEKLNNSYGILNGYGGILQTYGFKIPQSGNKPMEFSDFVKEMQETEKEFIDYYNKICGDIKAKAS